MLVRKYFLRNICLVNRDKGKEHDKLRAGVNIYKRMLLYLRTVPHYCHGYKRYTRKM